MREAATEGWDELRRLFGGAYPSFVTSWSGNGSERYLPVFTFHTLRPREFSEQLRHLDRNGFSTVSLRRAARHLTGGAPAPERSVVLTIDDGRLSTWTVGMPLLRRFGMEATAFVIPGYLEEGARRPTLEDGDASGGTGRRLDEHRDRRSMLRWSEVEALHESESVRVESHSLTHKRVPVSSRIVGFVPPRPGTALFDLPLPLEVDPISPAAELFRRPGAPLFEHRPLLATSRAVDPPRSLIRACVERVEREGPGRFFRRSDWRRQLLGLVENTRDGPYREVETLPWQRRELRESRDWLERRLPDKTVTHFCFPSGAGSERTLRLAREEGYATTCWGFRSGREANRPGASPYRIERLKHDYLFRLPGEGRRSLGRVLCRKTIRRLRGRTGY